MTLSWIVFWIITDLKLILYKKDDTTNTVHQMEIKTKIG